MKHKLFKINLLFVLLLLAGITKAQVITIVFQPDTAGVDAIITSSGVNNNYGTFTTVNSQRWTSGGTPLTHRALIKMVLDAIPPGVIVQSAVVYITGTDNNPLTQSNAVYYEKITTSWGEMTVTWANQPSSTTTGRYSLAQTTSTTQVDSTNITPWVQDWVNYPSTNYGFIIKLQSEANYYCKRIGASSDHATAASRPKLVVKYAWRQFKSRASGSYSSLSTWSQSDDGGTTWANATVLPNYAKAGLTTVLSGHTVTLGTDTIDEFIVASGGALTYTGSGTLMVNNGTGTDLVINGTFTDEGNNAISWATSATWSISSGATLIKSNATSCDAWRDSYQGGISAITPSANWLFRKTASTGPTISTSSMTYPNLTFENSYSGGDWTINYAGSAAHPAVKGTMNIGGSGTYNVIFSNTNTNATKLKIEGGLTIKSSSYYRNYNNTGTEVQGDLTINGTFDFSTYTGPLLLSGTANQTISAASSLTWKNLTINKTYGSKTVTMNKSIAITDALVLTKGKLVSTSTNLLTFNAGSSTSGVSDSSFVDGPCKKVGNTSFTFPVGNSTNAQTLTMTAPAVSTDGFVCQYFLANQSYGTATENTFDYISGCEYFSFAPVTGTTSNVDITLTYDANSCVANMYPDPRVIVWDATTSKWKDLSIDGAAFTYSPFGGTIAPAATLSQYGAFALGNKSANFVQPTDTEYVTQAFHYIKNNGQLRATDDSTLVSFIKYYVPDIYPIAYFADTSVSYVFSHTDTIITTTDTLLRVDVKYSNSNATSPTAQFVDSAYSNYFYAHAMVSRAPQYQRLIYNNIYNGIDLVYTQNENGIKYSFNVAPGSKPDGIKAKYRGADSVRVISGGRLCAYTKYGNIIQAAPKAFKVDSSNTAVNVNCNWSVTNNEASFTFPNGYNSHLPLVIRIAKGYANNRASGDSLPCLSTYYGGNTKVNFTDVASDKDNSSVFVGNLNSNTFPLVPSQAPLYTWKGKDDAVIVKFDKDGIRKFTTYLGGAGDEWWNHVVIKPSGRIFIGGSSGGGLPLPIGGNPAGTTSLPYTGYADFYIAEIKETGDSLIWRTYDGGSLNHYLGDMCLDNIGNIYLAGKALGTDNTWLLNDVYQVGQGKIVRYNNSRVKDFATRIGSNDFNINGIAVADDSTFAITGYAKGSWDFINPGSGAYFDTSQSTSNGYNAYICKLSKNTVPQWATYFGMKTAGTNNFTRGYGITSSGKHYIITGFAYGTNFPFKYTAGQYIDSVCQDQDMYISEFDEHNKQTWSTLYGKQNTEWANSIITGKNNTLFVGGYTFGFYKYPTLFYQNMSYHSDTVIGKDAAIVAFGKDRKLYWATTYAGNNDEVINAMASSPNGNYLFTAGITNSKPPAFKLKPLTNTAAFYDNAKDSTTVTSGFITYECIGDFINVMSVNDVINNTNNNLLLYPNPTDGSITVQLNVHEMERLLINIYDISGKVVYSDEATVQGGTFTRHINTASFSRGLYLLNIISDSESLTQKFVKQ